MIAWSPSYVKYKPRCRWFCKQRFADPYQKMDEKKLKNWNCNENGYKSSSSYSESFGLLPSFSKYHLWLAIHCSSRSTHFSSTILQNLALGMRVNLSGYCEWPHHFRRTGLSGHASRSKTTRNRTVQDLGYMLNAPSLQWHELRRIVFVPFDDSCKYR